MAINFDDATPPDEGEPWKIRMYLSVVSPYERAGSADKIGPKTWRPDDRRIKSIPGRSRKVRKIGPLTARPGKPCEGSYSNPLIYPINRSVGTVESTPEATKG